MHFQRLERRLVDLPSCLFSDTGTGSRRVTSLTLNVLYESNATEVTTTQLSQHFT
jgi:hypothetical protein